MKSQKIKLGDFYTLDAELNGRVNHQTGEMIFTGILGEKISIVAKYWLNQLAATVKTEVSQLDEQRNQLIKLYGSIEEDGSYLIPQFITEKDSSGVEINKPNPKFQEFSSEFNKLLSLEKEVSYTPIKLSDLQGVETTANYAVLFKFVEA